MTPEDLKRSFPPMPDSCRNALDAALGALPDAPPPARMRLRMAPVIALLLLTLMMAAACAAAYPQVLRWLLGYGESSAGLDALVTPVSASGEADGILISVTSMAFDGRRLSYAIELDNKQPARPAAVAVRSTTVDGLGIQSESADAAYDLLKWVPSFHLDVLPVQRNPAVMGNTCELREPLDDGEAEVSVEFLVLRPSGPLVILDERMHEDLSGYDEASRGEIEDQIAAVLSFEDVTVAESDQQDAGVWIAQGYTPIDLSGSVLGDAGTLMTVTASLTLSFPLRAPEGDVYGYTQDAPIVLEDCVAVVGELDVSPLSTRLTLRLIPHQNTREAAQSLCDTYGRLTLCDESGAPVEYLSMDWLSSDTGSVRQSGGQWLCEYDIDMPGLSSIPSALRVSAEGSGDADTLGAFAEAMIFPLSAR